MIRIGLEEDLDARAIESVRDAIQRSFGDASIDGDAIHVSGEIDAQRLEREVRRLVTIVRDVTTTVHAVTSHAAPHDEDPLPALIARDDVMPVGGGQYVFQGRFWQVFQGLQRHVRAIARSMGAREQEAPLFWPIDLLKRIDYFHDFPQQIYMATGVREDYDDREAIATSYSKRHDFEAIPVHDHFAASHAGLQPAVCDTCYYALRERHDVRDTILTTYGKVFRNERSSSGTLDRLPVFTVRDIMAVGSEDFVRRTIDTLHAVLIDFLEDFGFEARVEDADDPFFAGAAAVKARFQAAAQTKQELRARLPYEDRWIAIGSINRHLDHFGRAFEITTDDGATLHSGCIGVGFERAAFALFCQYGPDVEAWPPALRARLELDVPAEEMPR